MDEILTPEQWFELQGRIRKLYPELTDADLLYQEASEPDMLAMFDYIIRKAKVMKPVKPERYNSISSPKYSRKHSILNKIQVA